MESFIPESPYNQIMCNPNAEMYDEDIGESTAELYLTFSSLASHIERKGYLRDKSNVSRCFDSYPYLGDVYDILNCM